MSGYVPRKVSNARMRTKTNQTGLKMQGSASILGRRNYIQRYVNRRVQTGFGVDGYPNGWRCINGVDPVTASDEAKECNCYYARDITINQVILAPAPKNQGLAGGVGRINVPRFGCNVTCSASPNDHPHFNPPGPPEPPKPNPLCKNKKVNPPNSPKIKFIGCSDGGKKQTLEFSWDSLSGDKCVHYLQILMNETVIVNNIKTTTTTHTHTFSDCLLVDSNKFFIKSIGFFNQISKSIPFNPSSFSIGCPFPLTPKNFKCGSIKYPFLIDLFWEDNDPKLEICTTYYEITYTPPGTDGKSSQQVTKIQGQINQSTTIYGLAPDKAYKFQIKAFNNNGASHTSIPALECKTSKPSPLSDKLNLTFWWQITNSNGNIWDTNAPKSGNNFQKLVGYYLSFLNYTHHKNPVIGQKSVVKRVTFLIQNPGIPNKSYMRRTDNNTAIQVPLAPVPSIIQGGQYVPYVDTATGTVPLLEFFVKSCFKMFESWGITHDNDEFPQVGFIVDMGEPWQFYGLQNGTADNYKNYDSKLGDYWYRGPEGIRYYDKTGQFQAQDKLENHAQPHGDPTPTIPGFVPATDNKKINVCPTAYQVFRYISDLNHILESDSYTSKKEKMRISFLIADIEGGGTAGLTGESDIIKFTTDQFTVQNDIQKGQKVRQTLNSDPKNTIDGILAVALSAGNYTEIYVQPKKASVPFSQESSTLTFLATSSFPTPQPPVSNPNPIGIQSLSEGSLISNSNYMDCLMAHFSKDQTGTEVTLPSATGRPDVFGIQNQRIAEVANTKALPQNFSWGFTSSNPKFVPSTKIIGGGRVGPMLGAPEFYNLACGSFCEEGWDVGGWNGLGVDCMVCPESSVNKPQQVPYPDLDPSCNKFIAKTGWDNSRYLQYRNKSSDLFTKAGFKDKLNDKTYFGNNQAQFLPMFSIENKRSINTSDTPRPGDSGCLVNWTGFTGGSDLGSPCTDNSCGIGDFFGVWNLHPFYDYLHYISKQSEGADFLDARAGGAPGVTGKYSFAVYDCGLLPVEWIKESQSQTLDASVLAQLDLPSGLPLIQP